MAGPSWLAGIFAAVVIGIASYAASRIAAARRWRRSAELDADGVHVLMGVAMAGTLVPRLSTLPGGVWEVFFSAAAAWFAWQAARARRGAPAGPWRCPHPVPHLVESVAMLYMFLASRASGTGGTAPGTAMAGLGGSPGAARFPALALVMALYLVGYVVWTGDRLTSLTPALAAVAAQGRAEALAGPQVPPGQRGAASAQAPQPSPAGRPMLAPRLAACYKIAMGITMAYMLILMV